MKPASHSSAFSPLLVDRETRGSISATSQGMMYQPRPRNHQDGLRQPPRILPACGPPVPMYNPHFPHHYSASEFAFIPLALRNKEVAFGGSSGGFLTHYRSFPSMLFQPPIEEEKPNQSYIGLIGKAILSSPQKKLVLSDIYNFVLTHYPYYRNKGPGWRNSIRHNLSLNECFLKAGRSPNGKGHYWAINPANLEDFSRGEYRRKRAQKRHRSSARSEQVEEEADAKRVREHVGESTICSRVCRRDDDSAVLDENSNQVDQVTAKPQPDTEKRGFHIETLLGDLQSNCKTTLQPTIPSKREKEHSAFSIVPNSKANRQIAPCHNTSDAITSWSEQQLLYTAYPHHSYDMARSGNHYHGIRTVHSSPQYSRAVSSLID